MIQPNSLAQYKVYIRDNNHPNPKPNHFLLPTPQQTRIAAAGSLRRAARRRSRCAPPSQLAVRLPPTSPCARPLPGGLAGSQLTLPDPYRL